MAMKKYYGIYQGIVTGIKDPEKRGRIKVICPEVLGGETESAWCDPMIPIAYDNGGDFCIPSKEEMVWLLFIAGDVDRPVWIGGWWSESSTPLGENYSNPDKVRIINYADCTITMQDDKININVGEGKYDLLIEDKKVSIKGDLVVNGDIKVEGNLETEQCSVSTLNLTKLKTKDLEVTNEIKSSKATFDSLNVDTLETGDITSTGKVVTPELSVNGVSFSTHTHKGVTTGSDNTGVPN